MHCSPRLMQLGFIMSRGTANSVFLYFSVVMPLYSGVVLLWQQSRYVLQVHIWLPPRWSIRLPWRLGLAVCMKRDSASTAPTGTTTATARYTSR